MMAQSLAKTPLDNWVKCKMNSSSLALTNTEIAAYQLKKLQEIVDWAYQHSPFYQRHLQNVAKHRLTCLADLTCLPFTTASHIQQQSLQMLCVAQDEINRVVTLDTSGTTDKPKRLYFTETDQELTIDFFSAAMSTFTKSGDRVFILLPGVRPGSVGNLLALALERLGAVPIYQDPNQSLMKILQNLSVSQAKIFVGIPIQALALAKFYEQNQCAAPLSLHHMLLSTDYVSQAVSKEIRRILHCEVFDHYGMTEMGLGVGIECRAHQGYHLREADLYIEVIDPQTGQLLPIGEYGELVFTTLTRRGMPLIRYRSGDLGRLLPEKCLCGTVLKNLDYIKSRKNQGLLLAERACLTMADLDEALLVLPGVIDFIVTATLDGAITVLKFQIMLLGQKNIKKTAVKAVLQQILSIRTASVLGQLRIFIEFNECNADYMTRFGKRAIQIQSRVTIGG